jgi:hypothetical protein
LLRRTAGFRGIANVFVEDNRRRALRIEAAVECFISNGIDCPRLHASKSFNLAIIKLEN